MYRPERHHHLAEAVDYGLIKFRTRLSIDLILGLADMAQTTRSGGTGALTTEQREQFAAAVRRCG